MTVSKKELKTSFRPYVLEIKIHDAVDERRLNSIIYSASVKISEDNNISVSEKHEMGTIVEKILHLLR